jgi:hypothetical protein
LKEDSRGDPKPGQPGVDIGQAAPGLHPTPGLHRK